MSKEGKMTHYQGFKTKAEAQKFRKEHGGRLCGKESKNKDDRSYWEMACLFGGMDAMKYPWCVQWNEKQ